LGIATVPTHPQCCPNPFFQGFIKMKAMSGVRHSVHQPAAPLRSCVREILWVSSDGPRKQVLLPETTLTIAFQLSGRAWLGNQVLPSAIVSGVQQGSRLIEFGAGSSVVIVRFTETGAPAVLHDRVDLLYNQTAPLKSILPSKQIDEIQNILADTREVPQQMLAVDCFLSRQLRAWSPTVPQIAAAARMIRNSEGRSSITAIARHAAMSQSALERHFRAAVGTTPKRLCRLTRLQHVCRLWDQGKSLTEIAFEAGYCDQPHLVRDFRLFTGAAPEEFFRRPFPRNLPTFYK
jgi:AraC-like DNA-binding protein